MIFGAAVRAAKTAAAHWGKTVYVVTVDGGVSHTIVDEDHILASHPIAAVARVDPMGNLTVLKRD